MQAYDSVSTYGSYTSPIISTKAHARPAHMAYGRSCPVSSTSRQAFYVLVVQYCLHKSMAVLLRSMIVHIACTMVPSYPLCRPGVILWDSSPSMVNCLDPVSHRVCVYMAYCSRPTAHVHHLLHLRRPRVLCLPPRLHRPLQYQVTSPVHRVSYISTWLGTIYLLCRPTVHSLILRRPQYSFAWPASLHGLQYRSMVPGTHLRLHLQAT